VRLWAGLKEAAHALRRPATIKRLTTMERWEVWCIEVGLGRRWNWIKACLGVGRVYVGAGNKAANWKLIGP
jgi:hypothetical protein